MATLYISEYSGILPGIQIPGNLLRSQTVAIGGTSAQSATIGVGAQYVRLHADAVCSFTIGANPTATTSDARLAAGVSEYFGADPGEKVAVISNT